MTGTKHAKANQQKFVGDGEIVSELATLTANVIEIPHQWIVELNS